MGCIFQIANWYITRLFDFRWMLYKNNLVVRVIRCFRPWRFSSIQFGAAHAVEFPAGTVPNQVSTGDKLILEN